MLFLANTNQTPIEIKTIFSLFNESDTFIMPHYQRDLKWEFSHAKEIIDSFLTVGSSDKGLYATNLGQIILHKDKINDVTYIVDGQQRITRLSLILLSFLDYLNSSHFLIKDNFMSDEKRADTLNKIKSLIFKTSNNKLIGKINLKNISDLQKTINNLFTTEIFNLQTSPKDKFSRIDKILNENNLFKNNKNATICSFLETVKNYKQIYHYIEFHLNNILYQDNKHVDLNAAILKFETFYNNICYFIRENFKFSVQNFSCENEAIRSFCSVNKNSIPLTIAENIMGYLYTIPANLLNDKDSSEACKIIQNIESLNNNKPLDFFKTSTNLIFGKTTEENLYDFFKKMFLSKEKLEQLKNTHSEDEIKLIDLKFKSEINQFFIDTFEPQKTDYLSQNSIKLLNIFNANNDTQRQFKNMFRTIILAVLFKVKNKNKLYDEEYLVKLLTLLARLYSNNIFVENNLFSNNASYDFLIEFANKIWLEKDFVSIEEITDKYKNDDKQRFKNLFDANHIKQQMLTKNFKNTREKNGIKFLLKFVHALNTKNTTFNTVLHLDHFIPQNFDANDYLNQDYLTSKRFNFVNLHLLNGEDNCKAQNKHHSIKFRTFYLDNKDVYSTQKFNELVEKYNEIKTENDFNKLEKDYCEKIYEIIKL